MTWLEKILREEAIQKSRVKFLTARLNEIEKPFDEKLLERSQNPKLSKYTYLKRILYFITKKVISLKPNSVWQFYLILTEEIHKKAQEVFREKFTLTVKIQNYGGDWLVTNKDGSMEIRIGVLSEKTHLNLNEWHTWGHELGHLLCKIHLSKQKGIKVFSEHICDENGENIEEKIVDEISLFFLRYITNIFPIEDDNYWKKEIKKSFESMPFFRSLDK